MKQLKKYKEKYIVEDTFSLWLDIKVIRINSMINYMKNFLKAPSVKHQASIYKLDK